ncbi:MAG: proline--tRNA ligase [Candidatus Omnitrophica bacterium]|nr:proline--tRNA ligase [Candidatus Omnitrophota bacterium]
MLWSKSLIPTLKEAPQDAEAVSHKLMLRSGLIRQLSSGVYCYLPLGWRVLRKAEEIIRQEMDACGAQQVLLSALQPAALWKESGRFEEIGRVMISFRDRRDKQMVLGPTHEEVITTIARAYFKSYKQLPQTLYQIQTKFRDEPRPRFGVLRSCEFIMKDAYSFDKDAEGLNKSYQDMYKAYHKIFRRCGLDFLAVEADPGIMGGDVSHEFMVPARGGEDAVAYCPSCSWASSNVSENIKKSKKCPKCSGKLDFKAAIEIGHIFKLGTKYSDALKARFLDENGKEQPIIMGCYGIGVNRILASAIEQRHDKDGIIWPEEISPYRAVILPLNIQDQASRAAALEVYNELEKRNIDVLLDDRDERAGIKLKDADLIGIPLQVIVGEKNIKQGKIEIKKRSTDERTLVESEKAISKLMSELKLTLDKAQDL